MSDQNCSYSDVNGTLVTQVCPSYCCQATGTKYCSDSDCNGINSGSSSVDTKTITFWGILGGLLLLCTLVIILVYLVYKRKPSDCYLRSPVDELLETTIQEEVHTVTSETHVNGNTMALPTVVTRTQKIHKIITKQHSRSNVFHKPQKPVTIKVSPRTDQTPPFESTSVKDNVNLIKDQSRCISNNTSSSSPRPGLSRVTTIGYSE